MAKKSGDGDIQETFELELEYDNILTSLQNITKIYNKTVSDIGGLTGNLSNITNNMANQVNNALKGMSSNFANSSSKLFSDVRKELQGTSNELVGVIGNINQKLNSVTSSSIGQLRQLVQERNKLVEEIRKGTATPAFQEAEIKAQEMLRRTLALNQANASKSKGAWSSEAVQRQNIAATNIYNKSIMDAIVSPEVVKQQKEQTQEVMREYNSGVQQIKNKILQDKNEVYSNLSDVAVKSTKVITTGMSSTAMVIDNSVVNMKKSLSEVTKTASTLEEQVVQAVSGKSVISSVGEGYKEVSKVQANLIKDSKVQQESLNQASIALNRIKLGQLTDEARAEANIRKEIAAENYQTALQEVEKTQALRKNSQNKIIDLGRQLAETKNQYPELIQKAGQSVQNEFNNSLGNARQNVIATREQFEQLIAKISNLGMKRVDIVDLNNSFRGLDDTLGNDISHLKTLVGYIDQLKGVGLSNAGVISKLFNSEIGDIEKFRKELASAITEVNKLAYGPTSKAQSAFKSSSADITGNLGAYNAAYSNFGNINLSGVSSIQKGYSYYDQMVKSANDSYKEIENIQKQIEKLQQTSDKFQLQADTETNEMKKAVFASYANFVKDMYKSMEKDVIKYQNAMGLEGGVKNKLVSGSLAIESDIKRSIPTWNELDSILKEIDKNYEVIKNASSRSGQANYEAALKARNAIRALQDQFTTYRDSINNAIRDLQRLQSLKGLNLDFSNTHEQLRQLQSRYSAAANSVRQDAAGMAKTFDGIARDMEKSFFTKLWEGFRQIRWQTAALMYMGGLVGRSIEQYFIGSIKEIDEFRKSVFAMTATVGFIFGQDFKDNFDMVFKYSHDLMNRLQAEAAGSYATLADLTMVVRSVAQHGIFPHSDEDVKRINTLATSVKVLTEGMANEGVQMRQEIMALLEGRNRVTDTVARMLKNQGVDINKAIQEGQAQGKSMLVILSETLAPFAEVNKHIQGEWQTSVNYLKEIWSYIKRIAGEDLVLKYAKDIRELAQSFGEPGKQLTERGKALGQLVQAAMDAIWSIGKGFLYVVEAVGMLFGKIMGGFGGIRDNMEFVRQGSDKVVDALRVIAKTIFLIGAAFEFVGLQLREWMSDNPSYTKIGEDLTEALWKGFINFMGRGIKVMASTVAPNITQNVVDFFGGKDANGKDVFEFSEKTKKKIYDEQIRLQEEAKNRSQVSFQKGYPVITKASDDMTKNTKKNTDEIKTQATALDEFWQRFMDNFRKFNREWNNFGETTSDLTPNTSFFGKEILMNINAFTKSQQEYNEKHKITIENLQEEKVRRQDAYEQMTKKYKQDKQIFENELNYLESIAEADDAETNREIANLKKYRDEYIRGYVKAALEKSKADRFDDIKIKEKQLSFEASYLGMMERLGALSPFQKIEADYKHTLAEIEKMTNEAVLKGDSPLGIGEKEKNARQAADLKRIRDIGLAQQEIKDKIFDTTRKALNVELTETERIDENYKNIGRDIDKMFAGGTINAQVRDYLKTLAEIGKQHALNNKNFEVQISLMNKQLDLGGQVSNLLSNSWSSEDQRLGKTIQLNTDYVRSILADTEALKKFKDQYGDNIELVNQFTEVTKQGSALRKMALDYEMERIQKPFWAEMEQLAKGWADSISDTLTEILNGTKSWAEGFKDLFTQISKEIEKSFIKNFLVQPLMDKMAGMSSGIFNINPSDLRQKGLDYQRQLAGLAEKANNSFNNILGSSPATPMHVVVDNLNAMGMLNGGSVGPTGTGNIFSNLTSSGPNSELADYWAKWYGIDPTTFRGLIKQESGWNTSAVSSRGAYGLSQLMPGTARDLGVNRYDVSDNLRGGAQYYSMMLKRFNNNEQLALAAYNAGPEAVSKYGGIPPYAETQDFVGKVMKNKSYYQMYKTESGDNNILNTTVEDLKKTNGGTDNVFGMSPEEVFKLKDNMSKYGTPNVFDYTTPSENGGLSNGINPIGGMLGASPANPLYVINVSNSAGINSVSSSFSKIGETGENKEGGSAAQTMGNRLESMLNGMLNTFKSIFSQIGNFVKSIGNGISSIFSGIGSMFSGGGSGGGGIFGSLFGGGGGGITESIGGMNEYGLNSMLGAAEFAFAEGGKISEPVIGTGLKSGKTYSLGEEGSEYVFPENQVSTMDKRGITNHYSFAIGLNAIDTQTGVQFLMKNMPLLQQQFKRSVESGGKFRDTIRGARQ